VERQGVVNGKAGASILPWMAGPGSRRRTLIPSTIREMRDPKGRSLALFVYVLLNTVCVVWPHGFALCISHPPADPSAVTFAPALAV
jgi:hypothetical protein